MTEVNTSITGVDKNSLFYKGADEVGQFVDPGGKIKKVKKAADAIGDTQKFLKKGCFSRGTLVSTDSGLIPIEDIKVNDIVHAYDLEQDKLVKKRVYEILSNFTYYWVDVQVGEVTIEATRGHRFWVVSEKEWIEAKYLKKGMIILHSDGTESKITSVSLRGLEEPEDTFNFEVEDVHNYFVGKNRVLVHNGDDSDKRVQVDHYTDKKSAEKIKSSKTLKASSPKKSGNKAGVYVTQQTDIPKRKLADKLGLSRDKTEAKITFDVKESELKTPQGKTPGPYDKTKLVIPKDVNLEGGNAKFGKPGC